MKAAPLKERPPFALMKQTDIQNAFHLQMPRWLFTDPAYKGLSLEAKVIYTFLLNRFQLFKLNGWTNESGEVFIIYTRASLASEIQISYRKAIEAMKELTGRRLIWEKRCGRGDANQIYLARVDHTEERGGSAPFVAPDSEEAGALSPEDCPRSAGDARLDDGGDGTAPAMPMARDVSSALHRDRAVTDEHFLTCNRGTSAGAGPAGLEVPGAHPSKKDQKKTDGSYPDVSLSGPGADQRQAAELLELDQILAQCEMHVFDRETAKVFENAIERLFFSETFHIGRACLPQAKVRSHLHELDAVKLQAAEQKLRQNTREVKNSTAYTMAVIFNTIWECESDLLVDPYLNEMRSWPASPGGRVQGGGGGGMYLTQDQRYLMSVLKETRCLTRRQALRLLRVRTPNKEESQADAALRQLRYLGKIRPVGEQVVALAGDGGREPDLDMLEAVDVMLDLCGHGLETLSSHRPPFKLVFLTTLDDGTISVFAILPVAPGREAEAVTRLELVPTEPHQSVIFLLSDLRQRAFISVRRPHYFAARDNGRLRYFKGGGG